MLRMILGVKLIYSSYESNLLKGSLSYLGASKKQLFIVIVTETTMSFIMTTSGFPVFPLAKAMPNRLSNRVELK